MSSKKSKLTVPELLGRFLSHSPSPQRLSQPSLSPDYSDTVAQTPARSSTPKLSQRIRWRASTTHAGLTQIVQGLYDCSDIFLPLKTAAGVFLTIDKIVDRVRTNKKELEQLENKLKVILSIVQKYKEDGLIDTLNQRIKTFCQAIKLQMEAVQDLQKHPLWVRTAEGMKDADKIRKVFQNMGILCDAFQMDIQLDTAKLVKDILQHLRSTTIDRLHSAMTSYKTRQSSYGDPNGCLPGTRVKILADLENWALNDSAAKVYWLVGMAGTGKSTISHSLCEILDEKQMLGASVFCSRGSAEASDANFIIPAIVYALASNSPVIKAKVVKALEEDYNLASPTYHNLGDKFTKLIRGPISGMPASYKTVVIDALDECSDLQRVRSLLQTIINFAPKTPLKFFIASRDEDLIRMAFLPKLHTRDIFVLHEVEKDVVRVDIEKYLKKSLSDIPRCHEVKMISDGWPRLDELSTLLDRSGVLFIYAATVIRYVNHKLYRTRLSNLIEQKFRPGETNIDHLYRDIVERACTDEQDIGPFKNLLSIVLFVRNPLSLTTIAELSGEHNTEKYLTSLTSVIHIPTNPEAAVTPFHASFPDFITDSNRCSTSLFPALVPSDCHNMLALKCLKYMNKALRYNICDMPKEFTISRRKTINEPDNIRKISPALKYCCIHWAFHLERIEGPSTEVIEALDHFLHKNLLHWIECLSILGELGTSINSLATAKNAQLLTNSKDLQQLLDDGCRVLQMNFEVIQKHAMEIYWSALVWIPKNSLIQRHYPMNTRKVPKITVGVSKSWSPAELTMNAKSETYSVAFSQDGRRIVSGLGDNTILIWNAVTGEVEVKLEGHTGRVRSVAFSQDGSRVVSGSSDKTVLIWNAMTAEVEAKLEGHIDKVNYVAFSQDDSRVVSGSSDRTVLIWNAVTGEVESKLEGHTGRVNSVAFSQDGSRVISGSDDTTVQIWKATTGEVEAKLEDHTGWVTSVAFSRDGSQIISKSGDGKVCIWNAMRGKVEAKLKGHTGPVRSAAFSYDGSRVVSGSTDRTVLIWNAVTGEVEAKLEGHTDEVNSVAFSQDGSRVVSGSDDRTVQIWNAMTGEVEAKLEGHMAQAHSVAFPQDSIRAVSSSSGRTIQIWNAVTREVEAKLGGHTGPVNSVAFSQDGSRVVSGSSDRTVQIWNAVTGEVEVKLEGHTGPVNSVAFSRDGSRVVSGSDDTTVQIWNAVTGKVEAKLEGHTGWVTFVVFSRDGSQIISKSGDGKVCIWNAITGDLESSQSGSQNITASDNLVHSSLSISDDERWILGPSYDCWIPPHIGNVVWRAYSFSGDKVCLGFESGRVVVLDMAIAL